MTNFKAKYQRLLPAILVVLAALAAGCSDSEGSSPTTAVAGPEDQVETVEADEISEEGFYGSRDSARLSAYLFELLLRPCDPDGEDESVNINGLQTLEAHETLRSTFISAVNTSTTAEESCDNPEEWRAETSKMMLRLLDASAEMADDNEKEKPAEITRAQLGRLTNADFLTELAALFDVLDWHLAGAPGPSAYRNQLWAGFIERGQASDLHAFRYSYQTVVTGSTTAWHDIDATELGRQTGTDAIVLATPAAPLESAAIRATEMMNTLADVKNVVVAVSVTDFLANAQGRCDGFNEAANDASAQRSLVHLGVADGLDVWNRWFMARPTLIESPFLPVYDRVVKDGSFDGVDAVDDEVFQRRFDRRVPLFSNWEICDAKVEALQEAASAFLPANVIVVVLPIHPEFIAAAPEVAHFNELADRIKKAAGPIEVLDFSTEFTADAFIDPNNLNADAAKQLARSVAEGLADAAE